MGVVCFRLRDADDKTNSAVVEKINASGKAYLTQTKLHGQTCIRLGLGNILTTEQHLRNVWQLVQAEAVGRLTQSPAGLGEPPDLISLCTRPVK